MSTQNSLLIPEHQGPRVDYAQFQPLDKLLATMPEAYQRLTLKDEVRANALQILKSGRPADMRAHHLTEDELSERQGAIAAIVDEIMQTPFDSELLREAYEWKLDELKANAKLLEASSAGDMEEFQRLNEVVYGQIDEDLFRAALDWIAHDAELLLDDISTPPAVQQAAKNVLSTIGPDRGYRELLFPEPETFEAVRADHFKMNLGYYALLLNGVTLPEHGKIEPATGEPALEHVIRNNLGSDYTIEDAAGSSWGLDHVRRAVLRPAKYGMLLRRFIGLGLGHEIGSHLLEKVNGLRGPIGLAALGLAGYERGNEGRALIREEVQYDTFDEFGELVRWRDILRRYIAIGYGAGVGDGGPHRSDEVVGVIGSIDAMYSLKAKPDDVVGALESAFKKTTDLVLRVLKGTDGMGGAYYKDKVYLEGHVAAWLTANLRGPQMISLGDRAKFDISNTHHIVLLQYYGLLPKSSNAEQEE